jgi:hypothetical protein
MPHLALRTSRCHRRAPGRCRIPPRRTPATCRARSPQAHESTCSWPSSRAPARRPHHERATYGSQYSSIIPAETRPSAGK